MRGAYAKALKPPGPGFSPARANNPAVPGFLPPGEGARLSGQTCSLYALFLSLILLTRQERVKLMAK